MALGHHLQGLQGTVQEENCFFHRNFTFSMRLTGSLYKTTSTVLQTRPCQRRATPRIDVFSCAMLSHCGDDRSFRRTRQAHRTPAEGKFGRSVSPLFLFEIFLAMAWHSLHGMVHGLTGWSKALLPPDVDVMLHRPIWVILEKPGS